MKGWIYHVECPGDWSNAGKAGNYQILDAPHVMAMNKNPKWECGECGWLISGVGFDPPEECKCDYERKPFKRDSSIWDER
jgi:hypothetical protein